MLLGRLLCLLGLASIGYAVYAAVMDLPQASTFLFLSIVYLLGESYRRASLAQLSDAVALEFGLRDSAKPQEEPGGVQNSRDRHLIVRYGMVMGILMVSQGAMLITPTLLAVGKEIRTQERTADWTDLLSLCSSVIVVVAVLFAESKVYTMVTVPREGERRPFFQPAGATALCGLLALLPLAYVGARSASTDGPPTTGWDIFPVYALLALLAALSVARGNRVLRLYVRAKSSRVVSSPDDVQPQTFSLLLRPFDEDSLLSRDQQVFTAKSLFKGWFSVGTPEEQKICTALGWAGPPIAVGVPGEQIAPDGAARFYLPRHDWHAAVTKMMVRARLVVLILGDSDGVAWELAEAFRVVPPQRLMLIVPVRGDSGYATLQKNLREAMRPHLKPTDRIPDFPTYGGGFGLSSRAQGIIYFTPDRQPVYSPLRAGLAPTDRLTLALTRASVPVAAQLRRYESGMPSDEAKKKH